MRVDVLLLEKGLVRSRAQAQDLIAKGKVFLLDGSLRKPITKSSYKVDQHLQNSLHIDVDPNEALYVSRGGVKMRGALDRTGHQVVGISVLDIGISTGGFTDCLLQAGVRNVLGLDVGHGQLAEKLQKDSRVQQIEGVNARDLSQVRVTELNGGSKFDLIVIDVSFISLSLVLPEAIQYLKEAACVLALVKPQFEVGREGLGKNGIVKNASLYNDVETKIRGVCTQVGLTVEDYFESSIEGTDGNREFFVYAKPSQLSLV